MMALIRQTFPEVWKEDSWPDCIRPDPIKMCTWPFPYALCEDADSDDPADYEIVTEDGVSRAVRR